MTMTSMREIAGLIKEGQPPGLLGRIRGALQAARPYAIPAAVGGAAGLAGGLGATALMRPTEPPPQVSRMARILQMYRPDVEWEDALDMAYDVYEQQEEAKSASDRLTIEHVGGQLLESLGHARHVMDEHDRVKVAFAIGFQNAVDQADQSTNKQKKQAQPAAVAGKALGKLKKWWPKVKAPVLGAALGGAGYLGATKMVERGVERGMQRAQRKRAQAGGPKAKKQAASAAAVREAVKRFNEKYKGKAPGTALQQAQELSKLIATAEKRLGKKEAQAGGAEWKAKVRAAMKQVGVGKAKGKEKARRMTEALRAADPKHTSKEEAGAEKKAIVIPGLIGAYTAGPEARGPGAAEGVLGSYMYGLPAMAAGGGLGALLGALAGRAGRRTGKYLAVPAGIGAGLGAMAAGVPAGFYGAYRGGVKAREEARRKKTPAKTSAEKEAQPALKALSRQLGRLAERGTKATAKRQAAVGKAKGMAELLRQQAKKQVAKRPRFGG